MVKADDSATVAWAESPPRATPREGAAWWPVVALALVAAAAFLPILGNGFVNWDDDENFYENPHYWGLGWPQLRWAWTTFRLGVYQPLAWMLLEAQYVAFGLDPRGYHAVSLVLHAANAVILCALILALLDRCGPEARGEARWRARAGAALAAGLFAVHPLRVEVVAWASCQPYLPCAGLAMLSVLAYLKAHPAGGPRRRDLLAASWGLFAAAMLCKAIAVGLPAVLAILDVYPLRRAGPGRWWGPSAREAWVEKGPFVALSAIFIPVTMWAKSEIRALASMEHSGVLDRAAQATSGTWFYLAKSAWPSGLTAYYPLPGHAELLGTPFAIRLGLLGVVSLGAWAARRRWPGLLAAWAAYLVLLAPNSGLVRVGNQLAADRYSYLATIPLVVPIAYGLGRLPGRRSASVAIAVLLGLILALSALGWRQCRTWRDTESLWVRVMEHGGRRDAAAHVNLGMALLHRGAYRAAVPHFAEALRLNPSSADAHNLLGTALDRRGETRAALAQYVEAVRLAPDYADAHNNLGSALMRLGRQEEALAHFARAARLKPDFALARVNWGVALATEGRLDEAASRFAEARLLKPDSAEIGVLLAGALTDLGRWDEASSEFARVLRLAPGHARARRGLAEVARLRGQSPSPRAPEAGRPRSP